MVCRQESDRNQTRRRVVCGGLLLAIAGIIIASTSTAAADTVAYWRFEEGAAGTQPADQGGVSGPPWPILDSSSNGYHLGVLDAPNAPTYTSSVSAATIPATGDPNVGALDFAGNPQEIYARGYTGGGLNDVSFASGWTVEMSFRMDTIPDGSRQGILTKQGKPNPDKDEPPLLFWVRTDGDDDVITDIKHLEVRGLDGSGDDWSADSRLATPLVAGQWYNVAVVNDGRSSNLYIDSGSGYQWHDGTAMKVSGWFDNVDDWVIGRGFWDNATDYWMDGQVDEVRISNTALSREELLHFDPSDYSDLVTYTIDPNQSSLTFSGSIGGFTMFEQKPGSLTANLGGAITAHLDENTLTFDDLSVIDAEENPAGPFRPEIGTTELDEDGNPVTFEPAEENFAFTIDSFDPLSDAGLGALRDTVLGISRGSADFGGPVSDLELRTIFTRLDFLTTLLGQDAGSDPSAGDPALNEATGNLERIVDENVETITIPIRFTIGGDFSALMEGQIVASRSLVTFNEADFNQDGNVDGDDFLLWQTGFGTPSGATKMDGDFDNDEDVDGDDFLGWQANFGSGEGAGSVAVPEPTSLFLAWAALGGAAALIRRRR